MDNSSTSPCWYTIFRRVFILIFVTLFFILILHQFGTSPNVPKSPETPEELEKRSNSSSSWYIALLDHSGGLFNFFFGILGYQLLKISKASTGGLNGVLLKHLGSFYDLLLMGILLTIHLWFLQPLWATLKSPNNTTFGLTQLTSLAQKVCGGDPQEPQECSQLVYSLPQIFFVVLPLFLVILLHFCCPQKNLDAEKYPEMPEFDPNSPDFEFCEPPPMPSD